MTLSVPATLSGKVVKDQNLTVLSNFILDHEDWWCECAKFMLGEGRLAKVALHQMCDNSMPEGFEYEGETLLVFISLLCLLKAYNMSELDNTFLFEQEEDGRFIFWTDTSSLSEEEFEALQAECEELSPFTAVDEILNRFGL